MELSLRMKVLLAKIDKHGQVRLWDYHRSTVDALIRRGLVTILKRQKNGPDIGPVVRRRKGSECQNAHLR